MNKGNKIELGSVQETLLLPLWGRAIETKKQKPLLIDKTAGSIIDNISYDFSTISNNVSKLSMVSWIARSIFFDNEIRNFISTYPNATIVNVGCGLDTTFSRIDNGQIKWIDLDLPDSINLRKQYIAESDRNKFIAKSALDESWFESIKGEEHIMLLIAGVLYYFSEEEVKTLFNNFHKYIPGAEIIFDYSSQKGIEVANKKVIEKGGMDKSANLKWGINDIYEIESWNDNFKVINNMPMFKEHKKKYPYIKRIGMNISDALKIMSLAHIKVN
ncbi:MAG: class I SAM-dependent methyltransferase [Rikenellaceae bacterium]|nr:class I SAM-dependent methyltransferase [Rikenellaceae bacterium]